MVPATLEITVRNNSGYHEVYEFIDDETGEVFTKDFLDLYSGFRMMVRKRGEDYEAYVIASTDNSGIVREGDYSLAVHVNNARLQRMEEGDYEFDLLGDRLDQSDPDPLIFGVWHVEQGVTR